MNIWGGGDRWFWGFYSSSVPMVREIKLLVSELVCLVRDVLMEDDSCSIFKWKAVSYGHILWDTRDSY